MIMNTVTVRLTTSQFSLPHVDETEVSGNDKETRRNVLDHDQSNYSARIIFSCISTLEPNM